MKKEIKKEVKEVKKENKGIVKQLGEQIKLQLDYRTMIVLRSKDALAMWMSKYPDAKVIA
ncbi:MAG TPA: hypothetical protein VGO45_12760 [Bacteroidia bacterium]|jgi:CRISPR/Cas system CMR subunit Cmr6 (Cas7 group RAMP superfamily)|nr:hypothetical protein [Bacteroidia bacterium]